MGHYFDSVRGNTMFGHSHVPGARFGSGVRLGSEVCATQQFTCAASDPGPVGPTPDIIGLGLSIAHNRLVDAEATAGDISLPGGAVSIVGGALGHLSTSPGYVDTLIVANDFETSTSPPKSFGVSNGDARPIANPPQASAICGNSYIGVDPGTGGPFGFLPPYLSDNGTATRGQMISTTQDAACTSLM